MVVPKKFGESVEVTVNGVNVDLIPASTMKTLLKEGPSSWKKQVEESTAKLNVSWYMRLPGQGGDIWCKIAGLKTYTFAVPQGWFEKNMKEIKRRGGVIWLYDKDRFGAPMYFDEIKDLAIKNVKKHLPAEIKIHKPIVGRRS